MANGISSLFGPTAEEFMYAQQQANKERQQRQLEQGLAIQSSPLAQQFYQSGYNIASGLGNLFGPAPMADPRLARSIKSRQIMSDLSAQDLNDPDKLKLLAQQFTEAQMPEAALYFADRENLIRKQNRDYELDLAVARSKGAMKTSDLLSFQKYASDRLKPYEETIRTVKRGFSLYEEGKKESNTQAVKVLNREIANLSKDSGIGVSEIANLTSGGSITKRLADIWSNTVYGVPSNENMEEKLQIMQALEKLAVEGYNEEASQLKNVFSNRIDRYELETSLKPKSLSGYSRDRYIPSQTIEVNDSDINDFMSTVVTPGG
jgi:hypothetical protein